jgi:small subunit ribosomal protein S16
MSRQGATHRPFYRLVVSDSRKRPGSTSVDTVGHYDATRRPAEFKIDLARVEAWIGKGAIASERVKGLIARARKAAAK